MTRTPGPWTFQRIFDFGHGHFDCCVSAGSADGRQRTVAHITGRTREEAEANRDFVESHIKGCEGLDPSAYRETVEVLKVIREEVALGKLGGHILSPQGVALGIIDTAASVALARAEGGQDVG